VRIVVCVKWVPALGSLRFYPDTRRLVREGVPGEVSSFALRALGAAVALRAAHGGEVVALSMGPPGAREGLVECLALGADRALHLLDPRLAGSDTLATARALAAVLTREAPDLVLFGRASTDAETGQVGPEVAEMLDLPQVTGARRLELDPAARTFVAERETDEGFETVTGPLAAVVTAAEDLAEERFPTKAERQAAAAKSIATLGAAEVGLAADDVGAKGSPTRGAGLGPYPAGGPARGVGGAVRTRAPRPGLGAWAGRGRDPAPRGAGRVGLGLAGDAIGLDLDAEGRVRQMKPAFGGAIVAPILSRTRPEMATVRPGILRPARADPTRRAVVERLAVPAVPARVRVRAERPLGDAAGAALEAADIVLGVGRGIGGPASLPGIPDPAAPPPEPRVA